MKFLKIALLTGIAMSLSASAQAKPFTNADAVDEAENYEMFCNNAHDPSVCEEDQKRFTEEYQNAYAGDYNAQKDTAYNLWKGPEPEDNKYISANQVEACAWENVAIDSHSKYIRPTDRDYLKYICTSPAHPDSVEPPHLSASTPSVHKRINEIKHRIHANSVHLVNVKMIDFDVKRDRDQEHAGIGWDDDTQ